MSALYRSRTRGKRATRSGQATTNRACPFRRSLEGGGGGEVRGAIDRYRSGDSQTLDPFAMPSPYPPPSPPSPLLHHHHFSNSLTTLRHLRTCREVKLALQYPALSGRFSVDAPDLLQSRPFRSGDGSFGQHAEREHGSRHEFSEPDTVPRIRWPTIDETRRGVCGQLVVAELAGVAGRQDRDREAGHVGSLGSVVCLRMPSRDGGAANEEERRESGRRQREVQEEEGLETGRRG